MSDAQPQHLFPALLRYWRNTRGLTQLDLASAAEVSPRHVSFLETGRAKPSREMLLRLAASLCVPLRDQNALLTSAGFAEEFIEVGTEAFDEPTKRALRAMMSQHEPYPLLVFDRHYKLLMANAGTERMLRALLGANARRESNVMKLLFDPELLRPHVIEWEELARALLSRVQREALCRRDEGLTQLLAMLCRYEGVPANWRAPDYREPSAPTLALRVRFAGEELAFLMTLTAFQSPQNISLQELQIESYFPLDESTERLCHALAAADP